MSLRVCQQARFLCLAWAGGLAFLLPAGTICAASLDPEYRVTRWTAEQGLPENNVKALAQTRDGYLWLGTLNGLVRFDGVRFVVFDHRNTPEMTHDSINDLAEESREEGLWISTGGGLLYYRDHSFERYGPEHGIPGSVGSLCAASQGGVWFSPEPGRVGLVKEGKVTTWDLGTEYSHLGINQLVEENASQVLIIKGGLLFQMDVNTKAVTQLPLPPGGAPCFSVFREPTNTLLLCGGRGIWRLESAGWQQITTATANGPWPGMLYPSSGSQLWATERLGDRSQRFGRLAGQHIELCNAPEFPSDANVTCLLEDREGNLWVGATVGLFRLEPKLLKVHSRRDGLEDNDVLAVTMGPDGTIWVGTAGGINAIRPQGITNLPPRTPYSDRQGCGVLLADRQNQLWVPDYLDHFFLRVFAAGQWRTEDEDEQLHSLGLARALSEDRQGRIWVGAERGVLCKDGIAEKVYITTDGLSSGDVRVIYEDRSGDMWFGTFGGGLKRLHNNKITSYRTNRGQYNNRMWCIHEDVDGVFWLGSEDGLNRFVPPDSPAAGDRFFTFTTQHGLGENVVNNVQEDDFGYLWLSGLRGIYRISRTELNDVAAGRRTEVRCAAFGEGDGMLNSECNGGDNQPAGCKDGKGRIWFPTAKGVVVVDPRQVYRKEVPPPVVIEQVLANDDVVYGDGQPHTAKAARGSPSGLGNHRFEPGGAHALEIHYTANSLTAPEKLRFRHRLKSYDEDWKDAGGRRVALYTNLRPGNYRFEVTAANAQGLWSDAPAEFSFSLEPHFWQTWTFYILCSSAVLGLGAAIQAYRLKWQHRLLKLEEQRALANERARIARDLHDDLGTALTGLALQLDVARREATENPALAERFGQTAEDARELAERMREVVWTINPRCDNLLGLASFIEQQVAEFLQADGLKVRIDFPEDIPAAPIGAQARHQLALSVREALTNVVRHAGATEVVLSLAIESQELLLGIKDNGRGFKPGAHSGHGLVNMQMRMAQVGGRFECSSATGGGTVVHFRLPLEPVIPERKKEK